MSDDRHEAIQALEVMIEAMNKHLALLTELKGALEDLDRGQVHPAFRPGDVGDEFNRKRQEWTRLLRDINSSLAE